MKLVVGGNVITERLLNFTEAFVCLERLDRTRPSEALESGIMRRRSSARKLPDSSNKDRAGPDRTPARAKPATTAATTPRRSFRSPNVIANQTSGVVKIPAKRDHLTGGSKIPVSRLQKSTDREKKSAGDLNEGEDRVRGGESFADRGGSSLALSSMRAIQMEHLRECSVILKTVEIPETVFLDVKTKRRLSALFKACRKPGKTRDGVSSEDPTTEADSPQRETLSHQTMDAVKPRREVAAAQKNRVLLKLGKRKRVAEIDAVATPEDLSDGALEAEKAPAAKVTRLLRNQRSAREGAGPSSQVNPAKRRRVSGKSTEISAEVSAGERSLGQLFGIRTRLEGARVSSIDSSGGTVAPAQMTASNLLAESRVCSHCGCSCNSRETIDKNQPLITAFLRRRAKTLRSDPQCYTSPATAGNQSATTQTEARRDGFDVGSSSEPTDGRPGDEDSVPVDPSPDCTRAASSTNLPTGSTLHEDSVLTVGDTPDAVVECSIVRPEECEDSIADPQESTRRAQSSANTSARVGSAPEKSAAPQGRPVVEETCNESDKDRNSVSEVKLVLEDSSDGSVEDEREKVDEEIVRVSKTPVLCGDDPVEELRTISGDSIQPETVTEDPIGPEVIGEVSQHDSRPPGKATVLGASNEADSKLSRGHSPLDVDPALAMEEEERSIQANRSCDNFHDRKENGRPKNNHEAQEAFKLATESPLDAEKHLDLIRGDHAEESDGRKLARGIPIVPGETLDKVQDDDISDVVNAPGAGSEVLCFLGPDPTANQEVDMHLDFTCQANPEASSDAVENSKLGRKGGENNGGESEIIVELPPIV